jgi:hypothetical protein
VGCRDFKGKSVYSCSHCEEGYTGGFAAVKRLEVKGSRIRIGARLKLSSFYPFSIVLSPPEGPLA